MPTCRGSLYGGPLRIRHTSETKRSKLRFSGKTQRRADANIKKIQGLIVFHSISHLAVLLHYSVWAYLS